MKPAAELKQLGAVKLNGRLSRLDHLAESALRVAQLLGVVGWYAIHEEVGPNLADQVLELDISGMHQWDL